jgi:hypothetical protein
MRPLIAPDELTPDKMIENVYYRRAWHLLKDSLSAAIDRQVFSITPIEVLENMDTILDIALGNSTLSFTPFKKEAK